MNLIFRGQRTPQQQPETPASAANTPAGTESAARAARAKLKRSKQTLAAKYAAPRAAPWPSLRARSARKIGNEFPPSGATSVADSVSAFTNSVHWAWGKDYTGTEDKLFLKSALVKDIGRYANGDHVSLWKKDLKVRGFAKKFKFYRHNKDRIAKLASNQTFSSSWDESIQKAASKMAIAENSYNKVSVLSSHSTQLFSRLEMPLQEIADAVAKFDKAPDDAAKDKALEKVAKYAGELKAIIESQAIYVRLYESTLGGINASLPFQHSRIMNGLKKYYKDLAKEMASKDGYIQCLRDIAELASSNPSDFVRQCGNVEDRIGPPPPNYDVGPPAPDYVVPPPKEI